MTSLYFLLPILPPSWRTPSQPNVGLSSVSARFFNFVHLHFAHIHRHFKFLVYNYDVFVFATTIHLVSASPCKTVFQFFASSSSTTRCCCYFSPSTTTLRSSSANSRFATTKAPPSKTSIVALRSSWLAD